jgi:hypothetical protein
MVISTPSLASILARIQVGKLLKLHRRIKTNLFHDVVVLSVVVEAVVVVGVRRRRSCKLYKTERRKQYY